MPTHSALSLSTRQLYRLADTCCLFFRHDILNSYAAAVAKGPKATDSLWRPPLGYPCRIPCRLGIGRWKAQAIQGRLSPSILWVEGQEQPPKAPNARICVGRRFPA